MKRVVIEGIVDASPSGAMAEGDRWRGVLLFRPWRVAPDGAISDEVLHVTLPARRTASKARRDGRSAKAGGAYRFAAGMRPKRPNMLRSAEMRGRLQRIQADEAMTAGDMKVAAIVRVKDPALGTLVRPPRQEQFVGRLTILGRSVPLAIDGGVERASRLFAAVRGQLRAGPGIVARRMLPLANRVWLDRPISERALLRRLKPAEVLLDGKAMSIRFSCGETFGDHGLFVTISSRGTIGKIRLQ